LLDKLLGNLITISTANINAKSKCETISLGLRPDNISSTCEFKKDASGICVDIAHAGFFARNICANAHKSVCCRASDSTSRSCGFQMSLANLEDL